MKNVKKAILLMAVIFAPLVFTACEEEAIFDPNTSVTRNSHQEKDYEESLD